jgi:hypothetical protein
MGLWRKAYQRTRYFEHVDVVKKSTFFRLGFRRDGANLDISNLFDIGCVAPVQG